ncbi:hypothetical protein HK104_003837 [Borealophlyctis nickersoniae]|nr:hypothetical protein HK104_003837 [Borealophlyctis nickersoniae]
MLRVMNRTAFVVARVRTFVTTAAVAEPPNPAAEAARRARLQLKALGTPQVTPPKRPLTSYLLFAQQERENDPELKKGKVTAHAKTIAKRWNDLSDAQKAVFKQKAETARSHYDRAYATYLSQRTSTDVLIEEKAAHLKKLINPTKIRAKVATDPNRPKRPMTGYVLFVTETLAAPPAEQRRVLGESLEGVTHKERFGKIAKAWGRMSKEDQEPYLSRTKKAFAAYKAEKAAYDAENGVTDTRKEMAKVLNDAVRIKKKAATKKKTAKKAVKKVKKKGAGKKKTAAKKTGAKKTGAKKTGAEKTGAKKTGAKKTGAKKTAAKKTAAKAA